VNGIPITIEIINMTPFQIENQIINFSYSNYSFELIFKNNINKGNVERNIKFKAGIGNDICLYNFGNRKILKGEMVFEHQNGIFKRINLKYEACGL
jgi:hypothetical protein